MRPQAEAKVIRSAEVEPTSFGPLAEYRRLTGQDGSPLFTGVQTCAPGYETPLHWHPSPARRICFAHSATQRYAFWASTRRPRGSSTSCVTHPQHSETKKFLAINMAAFLRHI
jgi:hypothetical protein